MRFQPPLAVSFVLLALVALRTRADEAVQLPDAESVLQDPAGCLMERAVCAVRTRVGEKFTLKVGENDVVLDQNSAVLRLGINKISLIGGSAWIRNRGEFTVRTEFGEVRGPSGGFWVTRKSDGIMALAVDRAVSLRPRGNDSLVIEIWPGWQNSLGRVGPRGVAETGIPEPIPVAEHLERWARLYPGSRRAFHEEVQTFKMKWREGSRRAADVHQGLYLRKVARLDEEWRERERIRRTIEGRSRELRALFRRKLFEFE